MDSRGKREASVGATREAQRTWCKDQCDEARETRTSDEIVCSAPKHRRRSLRIKSRRYNTRTKNNALLRRLSEKGKVKTVDGGQAIVQEIEYSENGTYQRYSGYDILNITPSDVFTAAQYSFAQAAVAVSISGLEMLQNSGKEKMIDLLESRIGNAERTFANNLSNDCYSNGTASGGKQIGGLQLLVAAVNNNGSIGGIDSGTWGFWQNNVESFATLGLTAGPATMQTAMNRAWLAQARQADRPDLFIGDNTYFRYYWESLQAIQRIQDDRSAMAGFMSLKFMDADVVYDGGFQGNSTGNVTVLGSGGSWLSGSGAPSSTMYVLNTEYIFLRPHVDRNMVPLDPDRFSVNQDAMVKLVAWAGNMTMSNRFLQGVIKA